LREDNNVIRSQTERVADAGWLYFKPNTSIAPGELFTTHRTAAGLSNHDEMVITKTWDDEYGYSHNRYQQHYKGIIVEGAEYSEHFKNECRLEIAHGKIVEGLDINIEPQWDEREALEAALEEIGAERYTWQSLLWERSIKEELGDRSATYYPSGELVVGHVFGKELRRENYRLAWVFEIEAINPKSCNEVYVDAHTGEVLKVQHTAMHNGPAPTLYNGTQTIDTEWRGGIHHNHRMKTNDNGRNIHTKYDSWLPWGVVAEIRDGDDNWPTSDEVGASAHWAVSMAWDYFKDIHDREGMDGLGEDIVRVWADADFPNNASYTPPSRKRGNKHYLKFGTWEASGNNLATLDVVGHEFSHGVIRDLSGLWMVNEAGALNESFADIFGLLVERYTLDGVFNWTQAEDAVPGGVRSLEDPGSLPFRQALSDRPAGIGLPDTYEGARWYFGTEDNGGIHINCGVQNFWFHLLSEGGIGTNDNGDTYNITGVGIDNAVRITYYSLATFIQYTSQYDDAREAAIAAARNIFGICSPEHIATTNAWAACGIGEEFAGCNVNILGPTEVCVDLEFANYTYTATDTPGSTFTWNFPPQWSVSISGAGNNTLTVNDFGYLPPSFPYTLTIAVTSSTGGTDFIEVTLEECDIHRSCTELEFRTSIETTQTMLVSPNPATDELTINLPDRIIEDKFIRILDINGKVVMEESCRGLQKVLDISQLLPGVYYIKVSGNKDFQTTSFIKL